MHVPRRQEDQGNAIVKSIVRRVVLKRSYSKRFAQIDVSFHVRTLNRNPRFWTTSKRISTWICITIDWNSCRLLCRLMIFIKLFLFETSIIIVLLIIEFIISLEWTIRILQVSANEILRKHLVFFLFSFFFNTIKKKKKEKKGENFRQ